MQLANRSCFKRVSLCCCLFVLTFASRLPAAVETFPLSDVRLLSGPFERAQDNNIRYLLSLDPDRLLAPYRREAGMEDPGETYGNWEADGLGGHIGGHYVSALARTATATGNADIQERLSYMIAGLKACQDRHDKGLMKGYLGGVPDSEALWTGIADGDIRAENFSLNDQWVPWYNIHKTYAGLRDAYRYAGNRQARDMLIELADWALNLTQNLSDAQMQAMLKAEHGGMNEIFADVAAITGEDKYLELARRFSDRRILEPLLNETDPLAGLHANTQIPKVIGFERIGEVSASAPAGRDWAGAAEFFWETVVNTRTVAIGGNSVREHFNPRDDFSDMIADPQGPETCNTYNMLRLTRMLYERRGTPDFIDYYERALYNHILSTQHPQHGGLVYFTPMRPQHYRVYSHPQKAMWCCVGSGIENHGQYGAMIYAYQTADGDDKNDTLYVNLFIASKLTWRSKGVNLTQNTAFPDEARSELVIGTRDKRPAAFDLKIRYPSWVEENRLKLSVNGRLVKYGAPRGGYVTLSRQWKDGDTVHIATPMHTALEKMPDGSDYYAVLHGPVVLAAKTDPFDNETLSFIADGSRMGHVANGQMCPLEAAPVFVGDPGEFLDKIRPVSGKPLTFIAPDLIDSPDPGPAKTMTLEPFFRIHDSRYTVYWPAADREEVKAMRQAQAEAERARLALEALTVDRVTPGEQQPEVEHNFRGKDTESGVNFGRHWRHARGWFSYDLADPNREAETLRVTYSGADGGRHFDIRVNGEKLATVASKDRPGTTLYSVDYEIPASMRAERLTVKFAAHEDSIAGGVYDVRLLKKR